MNEPAASPASQDPDTGPGRDGSPEPAPADGASGTAAAQVGVIGLGTMGGAMARHLLAAGYPVTGRDVQPGCVQRFVAAGGTEAPSAAAVASAADLVILSLPSVAAFAEVVSGPGGLMEAARPGLAVIEMSTLPLEVKEQARAALAERGAVLLDCPVSGTGAQILSRDVAIYTSGEEAALARARPVLAAFSRVQFPVGEFGNGTKLKFVANLLVAIHNVAAAEALLIAQRAGLDLPAALAALAAGAGTSRMLEVRGPLMISGDFGAAMRVQTFQKDLDIIGAFARQLGCPTPLFTTAAQLNLAALAQGHAMRTRRAYSPCSGGWQVARTETRRLRIMMPSGPGIRRAGMIWRAKSVDAHDCRKNPEKGRADVADVRSGSRKRAVGTRDRVISHLIAVGEVRDGGGMASTVLAEAVGYPGSSVAFAQLLSGMERSGLIEREIRGKRTYRIAPTAAGGGTAGAGAVGGRPRPGKSRTATVATRGAGRPVPVDGPGALVTAGQGEVDYDELARRLLIQVVQRLASAPAELDADSGVPSPAGDEAAVGGTGDAELAQTVASLEQKLASVRSKQRKLTAENARLREQLQAAQRNLAQVQERAGSGQLTGQLDTAEVRLLERLLSPLRQQRDRREETGAG